MTNFVISCFLNRPYRSSFPKYPISGTLKMPVLKFQIRSSYFETGYVRKWCRKYFPTVSATIFLVVLKDSTQIYITNFKFCFKLEKSNLKIFWNEPHQNQKLKHWNVFWSKFKKGKNSCTFWKISATMCLIFDDCTTNKIVLLFT